MPMIPVWPAYLDYLRTALIARVGLTGVNVTTVLMGDDAGRESIQFGGIQDDTEWGLIGGYRVDSRFTITGYIFIAKSGAGETVAKAARDRATAIFSELLSALIAANHDAAAPARAALVTDTRIDQLPITDNLAGARACDMMFHIAAEAELEI